jgi:O-antigen ligase
MDESIIENRGDEADGGRFIDALPRLQLHGVSTRVDRILASMTARISSWLLFAAASFAPLPFGSNVPSAVAFWCIVLGTCLVFAPVRSLSVGQLALAGLAAIVVAAYALVMHEQLAEHPWLPIATPNPIWHQAEAALHMPLSSIVSIAHNEPWLELGRPLLCVLTIACGFLVGVDHVRARQLITVIAWSGAVYAAYGIMAQILDPAHVLWREKQAYIGAVTGPFINRNTAATYFGSCAVLWSLILWEGARLKMPRGPLDWRGMAARLFSAPSKKAVIAFAMLFLCLMAMFMTGSRAGVVLSLVALMVAFVAFFRRDLPRRTGLLSALVGGGAIAFFLLQLMGGGISTRFDAQGLADGGRLETYRATLRMIADHPWFGTGQGTFAYAFPAYRSSNVSIWGVWDMAHNTPLQIAAEMGIPIAALVVVAWIVIFAVLARGALTRRRGLLVPVVALAVATLAALHSLIDFPLQIPGYAIVALSLIGAGLAQSFRNERVENRVGKSVSKKLL